MSSALIFNKIRGSFVDGWGIRTTIFLKGCPLRCVWCCNPEGQRYDQELKVTLDKCTGCGDCVASCRQGALKIQQGKVFCNRTICDGCGECVDSCAYGAMDLFAELWSAQGMFDFVRQDKAFYDASGGGVTIGGGEASTFPAFCDELISLCHAENIHVAVDTCGYAYRKEHLEILKRADLLLYDIKGVDPVRHKENTGVDNTLIWENLQALDSLGKEIIIRLPMIPEHNDDPETLEEVARKILSLKNVKRADIICYHSYSTVKYQQLGREYPLTIDPYSEDEKERILEFFLSRGINAQLGG